MSTQSLQRDSQTKDFRFRVESSGKQSSGGTNVNPPEPSIGGSDRRELWQSPLTVRTEHPYKDQPMKLDERFVDDGVPTPTIKAGCGALRDYRREKADAKVVYENGTEPVSHRFNQVYADRKYAESMNAVSLLDDEFDDLWTAHIVLTGYTANARGEGRATVDHLYDLLTSNQAVGRAIRQNLSEQRGINYGRLAVIQPHEDVPGYAHIAWGLFCDGKPEIEDLYPTIEAHLEKCPIAREQDHPVSFEGSQVGKAIRVMESTPENNVAQGLIRELTKDLVGWEDKIESEDPAKRRRYSRLGATLMASNTTQFRPDRCSENSDNYGKFSWAVKQNTESWIADGGPGRGEFVGHQFEDDGEIYDPRTECNCGDDCPEDCECSCHSGGVSMAEVTEVDPTDDPFPSL